MDSITHVRTLSLTFPEQNIRIPRSAKRNNPALAGHSFTLLEFEVVCYEDTSKQRFYDICCEEPPRADLKKERKRMSEICWGSKPRDGSWIDSPCVSPKPESQYFRGCSNQLVSGRQDIISLLFTKPGKAKPVKLMGVREYFFVHMNGMEWERQECARWDGHAV
jgi:hypothetical protein